MSDPVLPGITFQSQQEKVVQALLKGTRTLKQTKRARFPRTCCSDGGQNVYILHSQRLVDADVYLVK